jgi:recombinase
LQVPPAKAGVFGRFRSRQGHLVGQLPWGYVRAPASGEAVPDPERATLVRGMYERYATGHESDSTIAAWLNAKSARTARRLSFGKDSVREMLVNRKLTSQLKRLQDLYSWATSPTRSTSCVVRR